jgi:hypothetical protein
MLSFTVALTDASVRLGADVDRSSFIVVDSHHLLLAGLPGAQRIFPHAWAFCPKEFSPRLICAFVQKWHET